MPTMPGLLTLKTTCTKAPVYNVSGSCRVISNDA